MWGHQMAVRMAASGPQPKVDRCALKRTVNAAYDPQPPVTTVRYRVSQPHLDLLRPCAAPRCGSRRPNRGPVR